jgi:hypothetical protein
MAFGATGESGRLWRKRAPTRAVEKSSFVMKSVARRRRSAGISPGVVQTEKAIHRFLFGSPCSLDGHLFSCLDGVVERTVLTMLHGARPIVIDPISSWGASLFAHRFIIR